MHARAWMLCVVALGCTRTVPRTEVMVIIEADPAVRAAAERVEVRVLGFAQAGRDVDPTFPEPQVAEGTISWPIVVGLIPEGGDASRRYEVTAEARDGTGAVVGRIRVQSGYSAEKTLVLRLRFEDACLDVATDCTETQTCEAGRCVDAPTVDPESLSPLRPGDLDAGSANDAGPMMDAPTDSGSEPDAERPDGGEGGIRSVEVPTSVYDLEIHEDVTGTRIAYLAVDGSIHLLDSDFTETSRIPQSCPAPPQALAVDDWLGDASPDLITYCDYDNAAGTVDRNFHTQYREAGSWVLDRTRGPRPVADILPGRVTSMRGGAVTLVPTAGGDFFHLYDRYAAWWIPVMTDPIRAGVRWHIRGAAPGLIAVSTTGVITAWTITPEASDNAATAELVASVPTASTLAAVAAAELDGDGHVDAVVTDVGVGISRLGVLRGASSASFAGAVEWASTCPEVGTTGPVAIADANSDGVTDAIVVGCVDASAVAIHPVEDGMPGAPTVLPIGGLPRVIRIADLDDDGRLDIVVLAASSRIVVLEGQL